MISVLFVCHGNICRSPMAEFIFKDMVSKQGDQTGFISHLLQPALRKSGMESGIRYILRRERSFAKHGIDCKAVSAQFN